VIEDDLAPSAAQRLGDPLATVLAMHSEAKAEDTHAYLHEQTRLARLQSENLIEQNAFEISHLKWRQVADRVRGVWLILLVLLGLLVVVAIGATIWSAVKDHSLVVESFAVPPVLAAQGETGTVVAQHVLDRIAQMQAGVQSLRAANSYRNNWGDDLKVQIPDTGVSFGEAYHFLVSRLGRETRITGEVVRSGNDIALTARAGSGAGVTVRGNNLDVLIDQVAERLFGETQPYRYGIYLSSHGREQEAKAALLALSHSNVPASERAWAYSGLLFVENDTRLSEQYGYEAVALNPDLLLAHNNLSAVAWRLGHSEFNYREAVTGLKLLDGDAGVELDRSALGNMRSILTEEVHAGLGDFANAAQEMRSDLETEHTILRGRSQAFLVRDLALGHDPQAARRVVIDPSPSGSRSAANRQILLTALARGLVDIETGEWKAARSELANGITSVGPDYFSVQLQAPLAFVLAKLGDAESARALAVRLPHDCYPCVIAHARIETIARNWPAADALFVDAVRQGPSLPFAFADWGASLLTRGEYDAAIAKFEQAHAKSPHFADALELWGEALMQQNRSDLALAKFAEANKYGPDWGRLHLEWGKALNYAGRADEAMKQFALAASLGLSTADNAALAKWQTKR
jgi:tetratricopeptide (TPR) repeat protein